MANALVCIEQGIQVRDWPTPTTVHGITMISVALDTGEITGGLIDITVSSTANQAQWKAALQAAVNTWALANGHTIIRTILPDYSTL